MGIFARVCIEKKYLGTGGYARYFDRRIPALPLNLQSKNLGVSIRDCCSPYKRKYVKVTCLAVCRLAVCSWPVAPASHCLWICSLAFFQSRPGALTRSMFFGMNTAKCSIRFCSSNRCEVYKYSSLGLVFPSAPPMSAPYAQQTQPGFMNGRPLYSPSMNFPNRNTHSPSSGENLPPPPYDLSLPPFPTMGSSGGGQQPNLPNVVTQHQQQHQQQLNSQHPASQAPSQGPLHAPDTYGGRPPPTPTYYTPSSTPQQASFPAYTQQSPVQSPNASSGPSRISPISAPNQHQMSAPQGYHRPPYGGYSLPAMAGPIMSNVHSPGNQMALVGGGMNMQYPQHQMGGQMYGHPGQQPPQNDRPFKCDVCPQSFNRNHDLKRHKRIHLAVKPFPCGHCEKSFSRKDALKVRSSSDSNLQ